MVESRSIQPREKRELNTSPEASNPGVVFTPNVDIFENDREITLLADMPGVTPEGISIDLKDNVLTLTGDLRPVMGPDEDPVLVEFKIGKFYRQFSISEAIDQESIEAKLEDGVLQLVLSKVKEAIPRKITVKSS
jgi:HSP20 family molecular chaperone IbpA